MLENYKDVVTPNELCEILGLSKKTIYSLLQNNEIANKRIGRNYRIRKDAIIDYLSK